jgi:hypothetical protein
MSRKDRLAELLDSFDEHMHQSSLHSFLNTPNSEHLRLLSLDCARIFLDNTEKGAIDEHANILVYPDATEF